MSCHDYEGVMSVLCTPLPVKCYHFMYFHDYFFFQAWNLTKFLDISNVSHVSGNPGTGKVPSCMIYCTALDKCVKIHSGEEVRRRGTVGIQMEGRLGLIVREAKCLRCSCCALRAGGLTCCWG